MQIFMTLNSNLKSLCAVAVADVVKAVMVVVGPVVVLVLAGVADATRQLSEGALQLGARGFGRGALAVVAFVRLPLPLEGARALLRHEPLHEAHALARVPVSEVHVPAQAPQYVPRNRSSRAAVVVPRCSAALRLPPLG